MHRVPSYIPGKMVKDVTVLLTNIPVDEPLEDLAANIHEILNTDEVGTFRIREFSNNGIHKKVLLDFDSGYDAMPAQELLHKYDYVGADGEIYRFTAKVTHNPAHLPAIDLRHALEEVVLEPPEKKLKESSRSHFLDPEVDLHQSKHSHRKSRKLKSDSRRDTHRRHKRRRRDHSKSKDQNINNCEGYIMDSEGENLKEKNEITPDNINIQLEKPHRKSRKSKSDSRRDTHRRHKRRRRDHSKSKDQNINNCEGYIMDSEGENLKEKNEITPDNINIQLEKPDLVIAESSHLNESMGVEVKQEKQQSEIAELKNYRKDEEEEQINEMTPDNINIKLEKPDENLDIAESIHLNESMGVEVKQEKQQNEIAELKNYRKDEEEKQINEITPDNINIKLEKPDENLDIAESINLNESLGVAVKHEKQQSKIAEQLSESNIKTEPRSRSPSPDSDKTVIISSKVGQPEEDLDEYDMNNIIDKYAVTNATLTSSVKNEPETKSPTLNINTNTTAIKKEPLLSRSPSPDVQMNKITLSFSKEDLLKSLNLVKDEPNGDDLWGVVEEALQDFSTDLLEEEF